MINKEQHVFLKNLGLIALKTMLLHILIIYIYKSTGQLASVELAQARPNSLLMVLKISMFNAGG